jgi:hypothetical protein
VLGNGFYLRTKENLERMQEFIIDEKQNDIEFGKIRIIKVQEEEELHLWTQGHGTAFGMRNKDMVEYSTGKIIMDF